METFSPKLDKISENIIYLLSLDSKTSISNIARILCKPRKIIENRVKKIFDKGYVKPLLIFNHDNMVRATLFLKLSHFDAKVVEAIRKTSPLIKLKETLGMYDLSILVIANGEEELQQIINDINEKFHGSIQNLELVYHDLEDTLGFKSFCHNYNFIRKYKLLQPSKKVQLGKAEIAILDILKHKPNSTYRELIRKTSFSYKNIKNLLDSLKEKKIIRFSLDPDYNLLGLEFHNLLVKVNLAKREEFESSILKEPRVHWMKRGIGRWDYILSICTQNISEFIDVTREIKSKNREIIFDASALVSKINITRKY